MRLAIADPPYLGRAALWYGGKGRSKQGTVGRAAGRGRHAIPDGARVRSVWEGVFYRVPDSRRAVGTGSRVADVLSAAHPVSGFVGSKPSAWTHWVLDMLGYVPTEDEVVDVFPGSGAVSRATNGMLP